MARNHWTILGELDPELNDKITAWRTQLVNDNTKLERKYRELINVAMACILKQEPVILAHAKLAYQNGATKDEILAYIEAIGGTESDAYSEFLGGLGEEDYQLVWIAQFGSEEDVIASTFDFDYDNASDLEIAKYVHKLTEDELYNLIESMTFEQYRRYLSIKEITWFAYMWLTKMANR